MTNREYYAEQIIDMCAQGIRPIIDDAGDFRGCNCNNCTGCPEIHKSQDFFGTVFSCRCQDRFKVWLKKEYTPSVDWTKVPVDTKILVRDFENREWVKRHFAYYKNGVVYAWCNGRTSYTCEEIYANKGVSSWKYTKLYEGETAENGKID